MSHTVFSSSLSFSPVSGISPPCSTNVLNPSLYPSLQHWSICSPVSLYLVMSWLLFLIPQYRQSFLHILLISISPRMNMPFPNRFTASSLAASCSMAESHASHRSRDLYSQASSFLSVMSLATSSLDLSGVIVLRFPLTVSLIFPNLHRSRYHSKFICGPWVKRAGPAMAAGDSLIQKRKAISRRQSSLQPLSSCSSCV